MTGPSRRGLVAALVVVTMLVLLAGAALAAPQYPGGTALLQQDANNTTPPSHLHPDEVEEREGDVESVAWWYGWYMADQLAQSVEHTSDGEYANASDRLGLNYTVAHGHYVNVSEEVDREDERETFAETRTDHRQFVNATDEFWQTYEAFQAAEDDGNLDTVRERARELDRLRHSASDAAEDMLAAYGTIESAGYRDMSDARARVEALVAELDRIADEAIQAHLVETQFALSVSDRNASYHEPIRAIGQLSTADGAPIANEQVTIEVRNRSIAVATDDTGTFTFTHRPVLMAAGQTNVTARYVPAPETDHLGSEGTESVVIEQVQPAIRDLEVTSPVRYGDTVAINGTMWVGDEPAPDLALELFASGLATEDVRLDDGRFATNATVPRAIEDGTYQVGVRWPYADRAIGPAQATAELVIEETPTTLTLGAEADADRLAVAGELRTGDDDPVDGVPLTVQLDGEDVGSLTTNAAGAYEGEFDLPQDVETKEANVTVAFAGEGTSLAPATASRTVQFPGWGLLLQAIIAVLALLAAIFAIFGTHTVWGRRIHRALPRAVTRSRPYLAGSRLLNGIEAAILGLVIPEADTTTTPEDAGVPAGLTEQLDFDRRTGESLLEAAERALGEERADAAIVYGYAAARAHLAAEPDDRYLTHWEFYEKHHGHDGEVGDAHLRELTAGFEAVAFAGETPDVGTAEGSYEAAAALCAS